jgi:hypothetical protein
VAFWCPRLPAILHFAALCFASCKGQIGRPIPVHDSVIDTEVWFAVPLRRLGQEYEGDVRNTMDLSLSAPTPTLDITGDGSQSVQGQTNQTGNDHAQLTLEQAVQLLMLERAQTQDLQNRVAPMEHPGATTTAPSEQNFHYKPSAPEKFTGVATELETCIEQVELHIDLHRIPLTDDIYRLAVAWQFPGDQPSHWARLQGEISG